MSDEMLTQSRVKELFDYDGENLIWKARGRGRKHNKPAGCVYSCHGYRLIHIGGKNHRSHRLIWLWVYGEWPSGEIDHIDQNKINNRIENLRDVTTSINQRNAKKRADNTSGISGVHFDKGSGRWQAKIRYNKKQQFLGSYACKYRAASIRHFAMEIEGNYTERHGK